MKNLTFLLYILAKSVNSIRPNLVEALQDWPAMNSNIDLANIKPVKFCTAVGLTKNQTQRFLDYFRTESQQEYFNLLVKKDVRAINIFELDYPTLLLQIPDPPLVLYCRGTNLKLLESTCLAIVGSRKISSYGKLVVEKIGSELAGTNLTLVSGLAYGVDAAVHQTALKNGLATIAVLGGGLDDESIYPKANFFLAREVLQAKGLLVSEYPPQTAAMQHQFIARNRIIAGLSQATIVVEAAVKSGALFTADFAMDYNRTVLAVPGSILSPQSSGTNQLIGQGAQILASTNDLFTELNIERQALTATNLPYLNDNQKSVLKILTNEPIELETLLQQSQLPITKLLAVLTELELNKLITQTSAQVYQKLI